MILEVLVRDIFGDDELTDGKSSNERSSTDREEMNTFRHPGFSSSRKLSVTPPSDLGTLESGPSQPMLKRYGLKLLYIYIIKGLCTMHMN